MTSSHLKAQKCAWPNLQVRTDISVTLAAHLRSVAPDFVGGFAQKRAGAWSFFGGESAPGGISRPFDLASISKPFTALLTSKLIESGKFAWSDSLLHLLPDVSGTFAAGCSIESLLSHRSGLAPHLELFRGSWEGEPIVRNDFLTRAAQALRHPPSPDPVYSDLGYLLVGAALEKILERPLDLSLASELFLPLELNIGSARVLARADADFFQRVALTENQVGRGGVLRGAVHDDNAWAYSGHGCCGHAGLFGTLAGVLRAGTLFLDSLSGECEALPQALLLPLVAKRPSGTLRMGFDGVTGTASMAGTLAGPSTFGHLGFTGTSLWCDPDRERVTVLLTNRVHPTRDNPQIREVRPKIHDFLWDC